MSPVQTLSRLGPLASSLACLAAGAMLVLLLAAFSGEGPAPTETDLIEIKGRVVLPDDTPPAKAEVLVVFAQCIAAAKPDAQGVFQIAVKKSSIPRRGDWRDWKHASLVARAPGFGPAWIRLGELQPDAHVVLELVKDDVAVRGRILDLNGRPVAGAQLRTTAIHGSDRQDLDPYLKVVRDDPTNAWVYQRDHMRYLAPEALHVAAVPEVTDKRAEAPPMTTDAEGRFELRGIGRERTVDLRLEGPGILSESFTVITRPQIEAKWKRSKLGRATRLYLEGGASLPTVYPAAFNHFAGPSRPVRGMIRAADTGEPLAGFHVYGSIRSRQSQAHAATTANGQYELEGLPTEGELQLVVSPASGAPYLGAARGPIKMTAASPPTETDFELLRGLVIRGRLIDATTQQPVQGRVEYFAFQGNPNAAQALGKLPHNISAFTDSEGQYQLAVLPGPGLLGARANDDRYQVARPEDFGRPPDQRGSFITINRGLVRPDEFHVARPIDPAPGGEPAPIDLVFTSGMEIVGRLRDPAGRPVTDVEANGLRPGRGTTRLFSDTFAVSGLSQGQERTVLLRQPAQRLGAMIVVTGAETEPLSVTLRPYATLAGRIVDSDGRPLPQAPVAVMLAGTRDWLRSTKENKKPKAARPEELHETRTDADGRFRLTDLIPGCDCELFAGLAAENKDKIEPVFIERFSFRSGETRDLGDISLGDAAGKQREHATKGGR